MTGSRKKVCQRLNLRTGEKRRSARSLKKSDSTVLFADGAYGGVCPVMMPSQSTRTCRARLEVKILPRSWKIIAGLPKHGQECSHPVIPTRFWFSRMGVLLRTHHSNSNIFTRRSCTERGPGVDDMMRKPTCSVVVTCMILCYLLLSGIILVMAECSSAAGASVQGVASS